MSLLGDRVALKHGAGGRAMRQLIENIFVQSFASANPEGVGLDAMDDGACIRIGDNQWLVITTDSHVVHPRFFPGGDVGRLSISGTVNDLAMMGATRPLALTCAVVLEEGFPMEELQRKSRQTKAPTLDWHGDILADFGVDELREFLLAHEAKLEDS